MADEPLVDVRGVHLSFGRKRVLKDVAQDSYYPGAMLATAYAAMTAWQLGDRAGAAADGRLRR